MKTKIQIPVYFLVLVIGMIWLGLASLKANNLLVPETYNQEVEALFNQAQKNIGLINIVSFMVLLALSFLIYKTSGRKNYLFISNLIFVAFTLHNYVSLTKKHLLLKDQVPAETGEFYLMVFVGVFYIAGAVLVTAIGYITIRNLVIRTDNQTRKINKTKDN